MVQMMLRWSAKELGRDWIISLFLQCSPLQLFPRICSIPAVISVSLMLSNCNKTLCTVWFPFVTRICRCSGNNLTLPALEEEKVSRWIRFKDTQTCLDSAFSTPGRPGKDISMSWRAPLYGGKDTDLVVSCRVRAAYGKLLTHRTHSAIAAIIIVTKAILIHFSGFLHSRNGSGFDRGVDSIEP